MLTTESLSVKPASKLVRLRSKKDLADLIGQYGVEIIAIGNGTASKWKRSLVAEVLKDFQKSAMLSSMKVALRSPLPVNLLVKNFQINRWKILDHYLDRSSFAKIRLLNWSKIDPKSIGVGQYQHDVSQKKLSESLDFVVDTVVNQSVSMSIQPVALLSHVAGLKAISENIVKYREEEEKSLHAIRLRRFLVWVPKPLSRRWFPPYSWEMQYPW